MDRLSSWDYTVVDLETTGFSPARGDRIVEIAVLRCRPGEGIVDRFATLVNPGRAVTATAVHGIANADVQTAPRFGDIADAVVRRLDGAVVVAHNTRFDLSFLASELARAGRRLPDGPTLCTMALTARLGVPVAGRSLATCCSHYAITNTHQHGAEGDARATARLLLCLLREARMQGLDALRDLGCERPPETSVAQSAPPPSAPRPAAARLATAARRVGDTTPIADIDVAAYLDLLDRVLLDRVLTAAEVDALAAMCRRCRLSDDAVADAHRDYLRRLVEAAWEDGVMTETEANDVATVATLLGLEEAETEAEMQEGAAWRC